MLRLSDLYSEPYQLQYCRRYKAGGTPTSQPASWANRHHVLAPRKQKRAAAKVILLVLWCGVLLVCGAMAMAPAAKVSQLSVGCSEVVLCGFGPGAAVRGLIKRGLKIGI